MRRRTVLGLLGSSLIAGCASRRTEEPTPVPDCTGGGTTTSKTTTTSPQLVEARKLTPDDGKGAGRFGRSVSLADDGATALVGARWDEGPYRDQPGAAYVLEPADGNWGRRAKLSASDGDADDRFGSPVALAGDGRTALVAAHDDEDPNGEDSGSAYVFERAGGTWRQRAKLSAADGDVDDLFGTSVALASDGTTALVGALGDEDPNGDFSGSAYVFERTDGSWRQQAKLSSSDGDDSDGFGWSVALAGDGATALVGASEDEDPNGELSGSAYVFERADGAWRQQVKLAAHDGDEEDYFGSSVALAGDGATALVGALGDEDPNGDFSGSAYVFEQAGGTWCRRSKLVASDGDEEDRFGVSVALAGESATALVGAHDDGDPNGNFSGSAYVFERAGGTWRQRAKLSASDGDTGDGFGSAVALAADATTALIGARRDEDPNGSESGSAYVFSA